MKNRLFNQFINISLNEFDQLLGVMIKLKRRINMIFIESSDDISRHSFHTPTGCSTLFEYLRTNLSMSVTGRRYDISLRSFRLCEHCRPLQHCQLGISDRTWKQKLTGIELKIFVTVQIFGNRFKKNVVSVGHAFIVTLREGNVRMDFISI